MLEETGYDKKTATAPVGQTSMGGMPHDEQPAGRGWIAFAGALLLLSGTFMVIDGIAAVSNSKIYVSGATFVIADLNTWGWLAIGFGALKLAIGAGVLTRNTLAVAAGILVAGLSVIGELLSASRYPLWALVIIALDVLAMYGLFNYGFSED